MILHSLLYDLRNADFNRRGQVLCVLAMLEETRALKAILEASTSDPEPRVRRVAGWAAGLIQEAVQRGHTSEAAINAHFRGRGAAAHEERLLDALTMKAGDDKALRNQLDLLKGEWDMLDILAEHTGQAGAPDAGQPAEPTAGQPDLLDSGLSAEFRQLVQTVSDPAQITGGKRL